MALASFFSNFLQTCKNLGLAGGTISVKYSNRAAGRLLAHFVAITSAMAHSVSDHLHVTIADYDRFIRTVIPHYETMRVVQLDLLARCLPPNGHVIDLGGGTGALAKAVAEKFPRVQLEIWDTDPAMLEVARERCAAFGDRVNFVERSFAEPLPACDAVVACIALHHVKDIAAKGKSTPTSFRRCVRAEFSPTPIA